MNASAGRRAVAIGASLGLLAYVVWQGTTANTYTFLPGARPFAIDTPPPDRDAVRRKVLHFNVPESAVAVLDRVRQGAPMRIEREREEIGRRVWTVTVPRREGHHAVVSYPPLREVRIVEGPPTTVEVTEFSSPGPIEGLVQWIRRPLRA